ncbi:GNAT family N-acetyltransferase [Aeromicrobium sp. CFBP 8757]|uniref:GNAT family N-acetyltransferase n=1 Tax=Aeromicrobium sp. CFBP 8757 TaxID=2775288 RepID=UPI00177FCBDA|nr:GNAT family N-acetyltransferase [Aeromicrobium sp. CFBP 8757]MBD8607082.1 GNAT family N-acetyltransferase [Aeromicrobium sp. CFBP 8757]
MTSTLDVREDDLTGPDVVALLEQHLDEMHSHTPAESVHALDVDRLRADGVTFWSAWSDGRLAGCGAIKHLDPAHAEIKSMRTADGFRGRGVAATLLAHMVAEARSRGYERLSLETGSNPPFAPARRLYERHGFAYCEPFGDYEPDPWSVFMSRDLV